MSYGTTRPFSPTPAQRVAWGRALREMLATANAEWRRKCLEIGRRDLAAETLADRRAFLVGTWLKVPATAWPHRPGFDPGRCNDDLAWLWAHDRETVTRAAAAWLASVADGRLVLGTLELFEFLDPEARNA